MAHGEARTLLGENIYSFFTHLAMLLLSFFQTRATPSSTTTSTRLQVFQQPLQFPNAHSPTTSLHPLQPLHSGPPTYSSAFLSNTSGQRKVVGLQRHGECQRPSPTPSKPIPKLGAAVRSRVHDTRVPQILKVHLRRRHRPPAIRYAPHRVRRSCAHSALGGPVSQGLSLLSIVHTLPTIPHRAHRQPRRRPAAWTQSISGVRIILQSAQVKHVKNEVKLQRSQSEKSGSWLRRLPLQEKERAESPSSQLYARPTASPDSALSTVPETTYVSCAYLDRRGAKCEDAVAGISHVRSSTTSFPPRKRKLSRLKRTRNRAYPLVTEVEPLSRFYLNQQAVYVYGDETGRWCIGQRQDPLLCKTTTYHWLYAVRFRRLLFASSWTGSSFTLSTHAVKKSGEGYSRGAGTMAEN
ncbi:hypothetical protein CPC08DRAFT_51813 [Agrocybe pediades]|nr:hypothetical protein CPC08DRAFT_51813 [Agrocybe pediades]